MRKQKLTGKLITGWLIHRLADRRFCVINRFDIYIPPVCLATVLGMQHFTKSCMAVIGQKYKARYSLFAQTVNI